MTDELDRHHQDRQQYTNHPRHAGIGRSQEMQYIMSSLVFESLSLVVEESAYCATQRYRRTRACRRFKTGNQAQQVRNENKETEGHQKRSKPFTVVADNFLALPFNEPVRPFEAVLQRAGRSEERRVGKGGRAGR